ncbi:MAG: alginate export family protein, partial [Candidatus Omnitrophica bacterium]|nr:alginate export family protein [Candidatus Omnitrophota bacterium]
RTLPHEDNVDLSVPGGKNSGRTFYGMEGKYLGIPNHGVYSYVLFQRDDSDEDPEDLTRDYDYNSEYFGLGAEGKLLANVRYATELILETGDSVTSLTQQEQDVTAWALDASVTYDVQLPTQPTIYGEYAFGSGDSDRSNVTNTVNGNLAGKDTNFLYFGYLPTGYALAPRLSNLRMLKLGMALKPLEWVRWFRDLTCSVDFYRYMKEEPAGGIFDAEASETDRDVGYEVDLTLSWQVLSDLGLTIEYGRFQPGDAYPRATNDASQYFSVSVTTTF